MINSSLSFYAKTVIYSGPHVRKNISGLEHLNVKKPVVFIANHTSFLDILLAIMLNPKIVLMVKGWVYNSPFFGPIIRYAGYIYTDDGTEENLKKVQDLVSDGYSLLIFPEGTRSEWMKNWPVSQRRISSGRRTESGYSTIAASWCI